MAELSRFGVSMDAELLSAFDALIEKKGYANRSEAFRDLVRDEIIKTKWTESNEPTIAALCMVFDHHYAGALFQIDQCTARTYRAGHQFAARPP